MKLLIEIQGLLRKQIGEQRHSFPNSIWECTCTGNSIAGWRRKTGKALVVALASISCISLTAVGGESPKHNYKPPGGYVPDAATAIKIAVAVWEPIYGAKKIAEEKPYHADLSKGVWFVTGSLPHRWNKGGAAIIEIAKEDGRILRVSHEK